MIVPISCALTVSYLECILTNKSTPRGRARRSVSRNILNLV